MRRLLQVALCTLGFATPLALATSAQAASLAACGDIHVEASAECEVQGGIECEARCVPVTFEAQCAADLTLQCSGECEGELSISAECSAECTGDCMARCDEFTAGTLDCQGSCFADCEARATAQCGTGDDECLASAEGSCEAQCSASCEATPPMAECEATCEASCEGSCEASGEAYFSCQAECQRPEFEGCYARLEGGCTAECQTEQGALFCDSRYVDHDGNLAECVSALEAFISSRVSGYAEGSCSGNSCEGEAGFSCNCTAEPADNARNGALAVMGGLFLFGFATRRRRR